MESYAILERAQIGFDYLHTNSTTHEFLFGAIAELIDNSRDAGATEVDIYTIKDSSVRGNFLLCFADNGCGMTPDETRNVIVFGRSGKKCEDSTSIGMYGNGLKSGSMRIGNDAMVFTKKNGVYTCLFLSRTFHEDEKLDEVIIPLPSFKGSDRTPAVETPEEKAKHDLEMQLIYKYSPFRCQKDFFIQFDKLKDSSGTLVIVYNMKLLDHGAPELDIISDPRDILLALNPEQEEVEPDAEVLVPPERKSLRAYVSILYSNPRMKVYLQGRKVQTKRLLSTLFEPRRYNFASKTFRTRADADLAQAKNDLKIAELRAQEAESKARDCELRYQGSQDTDHLRQIRRLRNSAADHRALVSQRQSALTRKQKAIKDPKTVTFYFGVNVMNRACDGMFVYNCSRLIKMYQRIGPQQDSSMMCRGVVGIVDVPYMVLEPTHNKQDFADAKEYRQLMRAMADHLMQYWDDLGLDRQPDSLVRFWKSFGYLSARWRDPPSHEEKYARRRCCSVSICVQCDKCLKWRILPFAQSLVGRELPDNWQCRDNSDHKHKKCDDTEQDMSPPIGVLKRKIKSKEQRQSDLEKLIKKKQEELELIKDPDDDSDEDEEESDTDTRRPTSSRKQSTQASLSSRKRAAPVSSQTSVPPKKTPPAPPPRAMTVADKKRNVPTPTSSPAAGQRSRSGLPLPTTNQKQPRTGGLVPKPQQQQQPQTTSAKDRRSSRRVESSSEEEEEVEEAPKRGASSKASVPTTKQADKPIEKTVSRTEPPSTTNHKAAAADKSASGRESRSSTTASSSTAPPATTNTQDTNQVASTNGIASSSNKEKSDSASSSSEKTSVNVSVVNQRVLEKFRVCLRYFLPPEWPMEKDQIQLLTEKELEDFPLENFFDLYEQGLRSLLATFQQETKSCVDSLTDLRTNVVKLIASVDPELVSSQPTGDDIDNLVAEYLKKKDQSTG